MYVIYAIIAITLIISLIVTPKVIKWSIKHNIVDIPKDSRRIHSKPMPRIGGLAIVISMVVGFLIYFLFTKNIESIALGKKFLGYAIGAFFIFLMGFIDDVYGLRARYKFWFQLAAAIVVFAFGIRVSGFKIPFIQEETIALSTWLDFILTTVWIICITCALNLIDGLDGLSAGIASIAGISLLIIFLATSASLEAIIITAVFVGALLGFLPFNFNPAKTFMGDVGSNFLGFTLSVVSMLGFAKGYTIIAILAPILALGVPIFDTLFAMIRRILKGQPPLKPDGAHIHHRLIKMGFTQRQAVLLLYTLSTILCMVAVLIISADFWKIFLLILAFICFVLLEFISMVKEKKDRENPEINKNFSTGEEKEIEQKV